MINATRHAYPVATITTADDTAITIDFNIITPYVNGKAIKPYPY